jgi:hypothetical protein
VGRRVAGRGGQVRRTITSASDIEAIRSYLEEAREPIGASFDTAPHDVEILGQRFWMPATRLSVARIAVTAESIEAIRAANGPPVELHVVVPDDVEVIEEVVAVNALQFAAFLDRLAAGSVTDGERRAYLADGHDDMAIEAVRVEVAGFVAVSGARGAAPTPVTLAPGRALRLVM